MHTNQSQLSDRGLALLLSFLPFSFWYIMHCQYFTIST